MLVIYIFGSPRTLDSGLRSCRVCVPTGSNLKSKIILLCFLLDLRMVNFRSSKILVMDPFAKQQLFVTTLGALFVLPQVCFAAFANIVGGGPRLY